jgi:hypothetical protein
MYSKQEASQLKQEFWTVFGQYMQPVLSAEGEKINWVNYKTGEKDIYFRMQADNQSASVVIEIRHKDALIQQLFFEQFISLRKIFNSLSEDEWTWSLHEKDEHGKMVSRIYKTLEPVNIYNKQDWPQLISFFKSRIIMLDQFWSEVKFSFELLH